MQRGRARVTDDGSLCLGVSRFGVSNSASHCELRHWKNPNSRALATLCDNLCRSMEARGDQKIHTFYCWRLKESTSASCHCLQCCCALVCVSVCVVVGETGLYTTCSYQRVAVLEAGSKSGTTHSLDLTLRSFCQPPPAIKSVHRMTSLNLECARRRAHDTKEARLARQQALAARARASQTTEACAWAHRLSLRGLQQVSVNEGQVIAGKKNL